jgi:hypothetical protein
MLEELQNLLPMLPVISEGGQETEGWTRRLERGREVV